VKLAVPNRDEVHHSPPAIAKSAVHKSAVRNATLGLGISGVPLAGSLPLASKDGLVNNEVAVNRHQLRRRTKKNMNTNLHKLRKIVVV